MAKMNENDDMWSDNISVLIKASVRFFARELQLRKRCKVTVTVCVCYCFLTLTFFCFGV